MKLGIIGVGARELVLIAKDLCQWALCGETPTHAISIR
jgi:hypothetical protein